MKIGIVSDGPQICGSMKYILQLYSKLNEKEDISFFHLSRQGKLNLRDLDVTEIEPLKISFFNYFFNFVLFYPLLICFKSIKKPFDIIHFSRHYPFFIFWYKLLVRKKIVITSLDLCGLNPRHLFLLKMSLKRADKIIAISKATKSQLVKLGIDKKKIEVIYLGVDEKIFFSLKKIKALKLLNETKLHDKLESFKKAKNILLSVGNDDKRKNTSKIYPAFSKFLNKNPNTLLVRVVSIPNKEIINLRKKEFKDNILFLQGLSENELGLLYNISDLLIFPSICEGFGLPLLESISCGTPCVTSNFAPMTEIVGNSGILINPFDSDSIYRGIIRGLANHDKLSKKSLERSKFFSLEKNSRRTHQIYKNLCRK